MKVYVCYGLSKNKTKLNKKHEKLARVQAQEKSLAPRVTLEVYVLVNGLFKKTD